MKVLSSEEESTRTQHRPTTQHERKGKGEKREEGEGEREEGEGERERREGGRGGDWGRERIGQRKAEGTDGRGRYSTYSDLS